MSTFHDELAALCAKHSKAAEDTDDRRVGDSNMIIELSAALGRTIGLAADGDTSVIHRVLFTATRNAEKEAAITAARLNLARTTPEGRA